MSNLNNKTKSHTEKVWEEEQEFLKNNQEEVIVKVDKAAKFRKENGYSLTMSKLMLKWNCKTTEEYRAIRKAHKKEHYIGPKKEKKAVETTSSFNRDSRGGSNNYKNNNKNNISRNSGGRK